MTLSCGFAVAAILFLAATARAAPPAKYNTMPVRVEGMVNVHIVPHSHDDVRNIFSKTRARPRLRFLR